MCLSYNLIFRPPFPQISAILGTKIAYIVTTLAVDTTCSILRLTNNVTCIHSRGRAEFRRCRRRRKSLPLPPAKFWSARQHASRIWFAPARKVAAALLRGLGLKTVSLITMHLSDRFPDLLALLRPPFRSKTASQITMHLS